MSLIDRISLIKSPDYFTELCQSLFAVEYEDFDVVDDSGGDGGNDGYTKQKQILFQLYCPKRPPRPDSDYIEKITDDLKKAKKLADSGYDIRTWIFVTPAKLREPVLKHIREEAKKYGFEGFAWTSVKLDSLLAKHNELRSKFSDLFEAEIEKTVNQIRDNQDAVDDVIGQFRDKTNAKYKKRIDETRDLLNDGNAGGAKKMYEQILSEMEEEKANVDKHLFFRTVNNLGNCEHNLGNLTKAIRYPAGLRFWHRCL
jgi:hypothetical protein